MKTSTIDDLRLHVVRNTLCVFRFLYHLGHLLGDLRGAIESEDLNLAIVVARKAVLTCAAIQSAAATGNTGMIESVRSATFDCFDGLSDQTIERIQALCAGAAAAADMPGWQAWLGEFLRFVDSTEAALCLPHKLPDVRTEGGVFAILRTGRLWMKVAESLGLPNAIPNEWA